MREDQTLEKKEPAPDRSKNIATGIGWLSVQGILGALLGFVLLGFFALSPPFGFIRCLFFPTGNCRCILYPGFVRAQSRGREISGTIGIRRGQRRLGCGQGLPDSDCVFFCSNVHCSRLGRTVSLKLLHEEPHLVLDILPWRTLALLGLYKVRDCVKSLLDARQAYILINISYRLWQERSRS